VSNGTGHILDMINRLKQNRVILPSYKAKFKENNRTTIYSERVKVKQPHFKKVSKEKLREIKKQIRTRAKSEYKKEVIIYMISVALALVMLALLLIWLN